MLTPEERLRVLTDVYNVPTTEAGRGELPLSHPPPILHAMTALACAGHYGVVRIGTHRITGETAAIKTVPKRRAVYVEMLRLEVEVLRVGLTTDPASPLPAPSPAAAPCPRRSLVFVLYFMFDEGCGCGCVCVRAQKLSHVNVVRLLDAFEDEHDVHLVRVAPCPAPIAAYVDVVLLWRPRTSPVAPLVVLRDV